jgi:hypothetical protein
VKPSLATIDARYRAIHIALKKELPVRLTTRERMVLDRAVRLSLAAERVADSPPADLEVTIRLENLANRARQEWFSLARAKAQARAVTPSLQEIMGGVR